jgi:hypothetical protein
MSIVATEEGIKRDYRPSDAPSKQGVRRIRAAIASARPYLRRAVISVAISSGRGLMKSSLTRPSAIVLTVAGIELFVSTHPAGNTTAFAGRPKLRSHTSSSAVNL